MAHVDDAAGGFFAFDTTLVMFFMAVDFGQSVLSPGLDSIFSFGTLSMLVVLPYFLPFDGERPGFTSWVLGRTAVAGLASLLGVAFGQSIGVLLPETMRFLPMTLLLGAAVLSFAAQFRNLIGVRLAR